MWMWSLFFFLPLGFPHSGGDMSNWKIITKIAPSPPPGLVSCLFSPFFSP